MDLFGSPRFGEVAPRWFGAHIRGLSRHSKVHHEGTLRRGGMAYLADLPLEAITPRVADEMLADIATCRGPSAANHTRNQLRQIYRWLSREGIYNGANPFDGARKYPVTNRRHPVEPEHAREAVAICLDAFDRPRRGTIVDQVFGAYFVALIYTGLREAEGSSLRFAEYDRVGRELRLAKHKTARLVGAKTIDLGEYACAHLDAIIARRWHGSLFFPSGRSRSGHIENTWRAWTRVRDAIGCPRARVHDIRHGFAATLYETGADLLTIKALLGHRNTATTAHYVGRPSKAKAREAADRCIAMILGGDR